MSRPTYVTPADEAVERVIADTVGVSWNCSPTKLAKFNSIDFALTRDGNVSGWMEIKRRTNAHDKYPTYMISFDKWKNLILTANASQLPAFLVVQFTDGLYYLHSHIPPTHIEVGGRFDRNDSQDVEPVAHFKHELLTPIKPKASQ